MKYALFAILLVAFAGCEMQVNHKHEVKPIKLEPIKIDFKVDWHKRKQIECPRCSGRGMIDEDLYLCPDCGGSGKRK